MSEKQTIASLISQAAKKLHNDFDYIRNTNSHAGEKGSETEDAVRKFLNDHMPKRFHATGGFVIDTDNQMSGHQDVIIYDALSSPVFRYEGANEIVSADAVASVIEVKSVLNKDHLENGYGKVAEVKRLKKRPVSNMDQNPTQGSLMTTATLGIVLGFESDVDLDTLAKHCVDLNKEYEYTHRPDMVVVLDVGVINYVAQFVGARQAGDLAPACDEDFVIPPAMSISCRERMGHSH